MDNVYLDTSAYLALILGEKEADSIRLEIEERILCSNILLCIETERTLVNMARNTVISEDTFNIAYQSAINGREHFMLLNVTPDLCFNNQFPVVSTPRSSDLIHLRSALWFAENRSLEKFISLDKKQLSSAREMGLPVSQYQGHSS